MRALLERGRDAVVRLAPLVRTPGFYPGLLTGAGVTALLATAVSLGAPQDAPEAVPRTAAAAAAVTPEPTPLAEIPTPLPLRPLSPNPTPAAGGQDDERSEDDMAGNEAAGAGHAGPATAIDGGGLPSGRPPQCPPATVRVSDADGLHSALATAAPGDVLELADGTYRGSFVAQASGTETQPVWLCGGPGAVLDGGGTKKGYVLHLDPARHWRVVGFTVRNGQKGVMADGTHGTVLQGLTVEDIGDEAIHLRSGSTSNAVLDNTIRRTGLRKEKFGEGIYIGSAESNWAQYGAGGPDRSDDNLIQGNTISETTSEAVDIKEGTTGGAVLRNVFDGSGTTAADSWVDVKGNDWVIEGNIGRNSPLDGFQTHEILDGWGTRNVFRANTADVDSGLAFSLKPVRANVVACDNRTSTGARASTNTACSG